MAKENVNNQGENLKDLVKPKEVVPDNSVIETVNVDIEPEVVEDVKEPIIQPILNEPNIEPPKPITESNMTPKAVHVKPKEDTTDNSVLDELKGMILELQSELQNTKVSNIKQDFETKAKNENINPQLIELLTKTVDPNKLSMINLDALKSVSVPVIPVEEHTSNNEQKTYETSRVNAFKNLL